MTEASDSLYVLDAHALWWYWMESSRLGPGARSAFERIERRFATGLVPAIVVAEIHYLSRRIQRARTVEQILSGIDGAEGLRLALITRQQLVAFGQLSQIPEMHDRLIAAVALARDATLISRDGILRELTAIRTIW